MDPRAKDTESLVRSHLITVSPSGLLTCAGGKWTTYLTLASTAIALTYTPIPQLNTTLSISHTPSICHSTCLHFPHDIIEGI